MLAFGHDQRCHPVQDACKTLGPDTLGGAPEHGVKASQSLVYVSTITMACHSTSTPLYAFGLVFSTDVDLPHSRSEEWLVEKLAIFTVSLNTCSRVCV
jgi:hypothetical protein